MAKGVNEIRVSPSLKSGRGVRRRNPPYGLHGEVGTGAQRPIPQHQRRAILDLLNECQGPVKWQAFNERGIDYHALREMVREGSVQYPALGIFAAQRNYEPLPYALSVLSAHGAEYFACLVSAAQYHGLITKADAYLWLVLPNNRNTLREVCGFETIPVRWAPMKLPDAPIELSDADRESIGWYPDMSDWEATERHFGVYADMIYGNPVKITSPARTICDLLMFRNRPIGRVGLDGLYIDQSVAFAAVREYCQNFDLDDAILMAERLGYGDGVIDNLQLAASLSTRQPAM